MSSNSIFDLKPFIEAIRNHHLDELQRLVDIFELQKHSKEANDLLLFASSLGNAQSVEFLIPYADPQFNNSIALLNVLLEGRFDMNSSYLHCAKLLLPLSDVHNWGSDILDSIAPEAKILIEQYQLNQHLQFSQKKDKSIPRI